MTGVQASDLAQLPTAGAPYPASRFDVSEKRRIDGARFVSGTSQFSEPRRSQFSGPLQSPGEVPA